MARATRTIALEEHFTVPGRDRASSAARDPRDVELRTDFGLRIQEMDGYGIDFQMLSVSGPKLKATSSAVMASPLWKRTFCRSLSSSVRPSMRRKLSARPGLSERSPVQAWSVSVSAKV